MNKLNFNRKKTIKIQLTINNYQIIIIKLYLCSNTEDDRYVIFYKI